MSDELQSGNGTGDDTLAGEYVLGVLSPEHRALVAARLRSEPEFAARVAFWESRLSPLADAVQPAVPPARVWNRIESDLFADSAATAGWWSNLALWRWLAAGSSLAAAASIALLLTVGVPQPQNNLVAALQASNAGPSYIATLDAGSGQLLISPVTAASDATRVPELWLIPADGVPRSLGLIAESGETRVIMPNAMRDLAGPAATLAITLEPQGGAPEGKPTGPVIAAGALHAL
jgi:anti-sigma-K factor RskA